MVEVEGEANDDRQEKEARGRVHHARRESGLKINGVDGRSWLLVDGCGLLAER